MSHEVDSNFKKQLFGERMIGAGLITPEERDIILAAQARQVKEGKPKMRFGEMAVELGFTTPQAVESLPGFIGEKLVEAGIISPEQQLSLIGKQQELREQGRYMRFGDLVVDSGFCTREEIETVMALKNLNLL